MRVGTKQEARLSRPSFGRSVWLALAVTGQLVGPRAHGQGTAAKPPKNSCSATQVVIVDQQASWHCSIALTTSDAFVVRVDQRDVDVVVSLQDAKGQQALAVDSPTKRASAEVMLVGPRLSGTYTLMVQA